MLQMRLKVRYSVFITKKIDQCSNCSLLLWCHSVFGTKLVEPSKPVKPLSERVLQLGAVCVADELVDAAEDRGEQSLELVVVEDEEQVEDSSQHLGPGQYVSLTVLKYTQQTLAASRFNSTLN